MTALNHKTRTTTTDASPKPTASTSARSYRYSEDFYRYIETGSARSAEIVVPLVLQKLSPACVLDVGCGAGAWLSQYRECGVTDYLGVDGTDISGNSLLIPIEHFQKQDVAQPFDLERRFDLVQCLEVGEHIPAASSGTLIDNLTRHGTRILFSAATPGQGGENHINEQKHEFWRLLFARNGYKPFDLFRPTIKGVAKVESWYRRNILLYVSEAAIPELPPAVRDSGVRDDQLIPEITSFLYRIQARMLSLLPTWWVSKIALIKHNIVIACRSLRDNK